MSVGVMKMLYCAHAIFYFKLINQSQESFLIHENVYMIEAYDLESARRLSIQVAKENEDLNQDGHLELNEEKVAYLFAGIRKIIEIESSPNPIVASGLSGIELTYSEFEVDTLDQVLTLACGEMVEVLYRE